MATSRITVGLNEDGRVSSRKTPMQPPGGMCHISNEMQMLPDHEHGFDLRHGSRCTKPPGGASSIFSDDTSSCASSVDSRSSSASPKTPVKTYKMASSFELSDEQPPEANRLRRPFKRSVNPLTGELIGCPGVIVSDEPAPAPTAVANTVSPQRPKGRVPPGGYTTPLW